MRLGKKPARHDLRTLRLSKYLKALPAAGPFADWTSAVQVPWGMDGNDKVGDCFWAMCAHAVMTWSANSGDIIVPTTDQVLEAYSAATGYNPSDPNSDQGTEMVAGLNFMRQTGIAGNKIGAYVAVDWKNHDEVMSALMLFGGLLIGVAFPQAWFNTHHWRGLPALSPIAGGHAIWSPRAILSAPPVANDGLGIVSWGDGSYWMTWDALDQFCDEMFVTLPPEWLNADGQAPNGLDIAALQADLVQVTA